MSYSFRNGLKANGAFVQKTSVAQFTIAVFVHCVEVSSVQRDSTCITIEALDMKHLIHGAKPLFGTHYSLVASHAIAVVRI